MNDWTTCLLGELIDINRFNINNDYKFESINYYDISSIGTGEISKPKEIPLSEAPSRAKRIIKPGDTIISTVRPGNRSFYFFEEVKENDIVSTGFAVLSPKDSSIDGKFIYYLISSQSFTNYLVANEQGAAYPAVNISVIEKAKIKLPPLAIRKKIVKILSNYDDLIENNLNRIRLLEEYASLTYEEWFLRFRINGKKLTLDKITSLPKGWKQVDLGECVNNYDSKRKPLSKMVREERPGEYPYYGAASVLNYIDDYLFDGRYLLIGEDGTVQTSEGFPMLQFIDSKFWVSNHAHVITGKKVSTEFLYLSLSKYPISNHITGAAQPKINQTNLNRIPIIFADKEIMDNFQELIEPLFNEIFNLNNINKLLKETRDILLPRLMTGMIDTAKMDIAI